MTHDEIITWQAVLTDHQAYTYEALQTISKRPVICYVAHTENAARHTQGWNDISVQSLNRVVIPKKYFLYHCFKNLLKYRRNVHIFASPFENYRLIICLFFASLLKAKIYLISEPYSPIKANYYSDLAPSFPWLKHILRPWVYRFYIAILRHRLIGVFAISPLAEKQYKDAGISPKNLFPFGYFIPKALDDAPLKNTLQVESSDKSLRLVFVGALIHRKGLDILLRAVSRLLDLGYFMSLDIYGYRNSNYAIDEHPRIQYKGVIPFGKSQEVIAQYDVLVLPSRHDGWGVVVNEALCASVPAICSTAVGIGDLVRSFGAGLLFQSEDDVSLAKVIKRLIDEPNLLNNLKDGAKLAANAIQPTVGAQYLFEILTIEGEQSIKAPWRPMLG